MVQRHPKRSDQEWMELIQECRTSGLTDKAWCERNHIQRSSLYYHIRRFRNMACEIPENPVLLWSSFFVTLQPNFCYGIIRHHNVPRKAFCNYCKNADVHDYNVHMQILPLQYTVLFLSDNNVDRLTHFLMY